MLNFRIQKVYFQFTETRFEPCLKTHVVSFNWNIVNYQYFHQSFT